MACHPTALDRDGFVLVLIDMQDKLAGAMERRDATVARACLLARFAGILAAPIIVTRQYPAGLGDTVPELAAAVDEAVRDGSRVEVVDKTAFCCLSEPTFATTLASLARPQVLVAGMEAHVCVAQTASALAASGGLVQVAADACCSRRDTDRDTALARLRHEGVVVTTAEAAVYEALGSAGTPEFKAMLARVR